MKDLLKTILSARKRADIETNACMSRKGAACEAAHSPRMSEGVSACGAVGVLARFGAAAAALMLAVAALFAAYSFVAPQKALALNPAAKEIHVTTVDEMMQLIRLSRGMDGSYVSFQGQKIVLDDDIDFKAMQDGDGKIDQIITELGSLTFGDKDHPFKGEFDGGGHYIKNLNYKRNLWKPKANTGLFSFTEGAYLHDVHFKDCYIGADFRGGVLVGQAWNTRIESVRMEDCTISVTPANNAVSLITNAGVMGGIVAGELRGGSHMYNCTVQGGRAVNNSVVGISGLGGEGLYLGALVGSAENSEIEYCRVLPSIKYYEDRKANPDVDVYAKDADGHYLYQTEVYNRYEVAVGAVSGQGVYAGGVVGYAKDVDVVDCFSTAWVHTWVANYVGVGAGNIGYVGGIIAHSKSDGDNGTTSQVIRSHYAGNMESYQWNAVAVIPIIQSNVYLAGLVERDWNEDTRLYNSYFKRNDIVGKDEAIKPYPQGYVRSLGDWLGLNHGDGSSAAGFSYGPIADDAKYADRLFWEGEGYDFEGDELRYSTIDNQGEGHINKWIMDDYLGIPVHGSSVKATLDFPGAGDVTPDVGDVTISASSLGKEQKTDDPYNFAVQAISANETDLTFTATLNTDRSSDPFKMVSSDANEGFRFQGWYRNKGVTPNHIQQGNHAFFDPMVPPESNDNQVFNSDADKLNLTYDAHNSGTGDERGTQFADNDLFVAYYQAQVLFHGVKGEVLDLTGAANADTSDDWYNHQDLLPVVPEPAVRDGVDGGAKFLGWTTQKNATTGGGWPNVTMSELNGMKANGEFFEGGESIERPMDLYPVYASLGMNINVIAEGHELDSTSSDLNVREGVLEANVTAVDGKYVLSVQGYDADEKLMPEGELPDGYRFLGWYEVEVDEAGEPVVDSTYGNAVMQDWGKWNKDPKENVMPVSTVSANVYQHGLRLSAKPTYTIPADTDLTKKHAYIARFEYRVDYYAKTPSAEKPTEWSSPYLMASVWEPYLGKFNDIPGPEFYDWRHDHWTLDKIDGCAETEEHRAENRLVAGVVSHTLVNGHNVDQGGDAYGMEIYSDFPNSATFDTGHLASGVFFEVYATTKNDFQLEGGTWVRTHERNYSIIKESYEAPHKYTWRLGAMSSGAEYWIEARLTAEVDFVDAGGTVDAPTPVTVTRGYEKYENYDPQTGTYENNYQPVLLERDRVYTYRYPVREGFEDGGKPMSAMPCVDRPEDGPQPLTTTSAASPKDAEMQAKRPGSLFVGWIDKTEIAHGSMTKAEYDAVYDESTRTARVSIDVISPYLVTEETLCERPMTLYPVYADYDCATTTNITRDTTLTDPANPVIDPALADVAINPDGTKAVTVKADVDPETAKEYSLVSWTIESPEGTVVDTVRATDPEGNPAKADGTAVSNGNTTLKYPIKAGQPYVIVANYEANRDAELDVTYHTSVGETEVVKKHAGDALGKAPAVSFDVPNAALVGWTEQKPAVGAEYLMFDQADAAKMVDEYTVVQRPMELWPVYRAIGTEGDQANVRVNSNIDAEHPDPDDHRRATVKTATTPQGTQTYVALEADAVDGYKFIGWYEKFESVSKNDKNEIVVVGTPVPGNRVTGDEMFAGNLYTAVYMKQQVYSVIYHFPDGSTSTVEIDEGDTTAFVQEIQPPKLDEDGNPIIGPDGKPVLGEEVDAMVVGGEETAAIEGALDAKNKAGDVRELFKEWQWKKDGAFVAWADFSTKSIAESAKTQGNVMHLYPTTYRFSAQEWKADGTSQDGGGFVPYKASNLAWYLNPAAQAGEQSVKVAFNPGVLYLSNRLSIRMNEVEYNDAATHDAPLVETSKGVKDRLVGLYADFTDVSDKDVQALDVKTTGANGWEPGQAVFEFKNDGSLTIEKTAPVDASDATFSFEVEAVDRVETTAADGAVTVEYKSKDPVQKVTAFVTVKAGEGIAGSKGTVSISLPWGYYRVLESDWGWQYDSSMKLFMNGFTNENLPADVILVKSQSNKAEVENTPNGSKWQGGDARVTNKFGWPDVAAEATRAAVLANPTAEGGN